MGSPVSVPKSAWRQYFLKGLEKVDLSTNGLSSKSMDYQIQIAAELADYAAAEESKRSFPAGD